MAVGHSRMNFALAFGTSQQKALGQIFS